MRPELKDNAYLRKITPHLWFDNQAKEAAELYTSAFENSAVKNVSTIHDTPSGEADIVTIDLAGQEFILLSAGPLFKFTPAVSFLIACDSKEEAEAFWSKLSEGGTALMELGKYPFSETYGWTTDRYGLSWQVMAMGDRTINQKITPTLMFVGDVAGKAEDAINFYASVFDESKIGNIMRYEVGEDPDTAGTIKHAAFTLEGQEFAAMDSAHEHAFGFNEAVSLMVYCENQHEIDHYWDKLSAHPQSEQCGWLKDKYGLSWQIVPTAMNKMLESQDSAAVARVTESFLKMKKFDLGQLQKAYDG